VSPRYFEAMHIPLLRGRLFSEEDRSDADPVAIVSESLALRYFPGEDPIGRRIRGGSRGNPAVWRTIVGVVGDVRVEALDTLPRPQYYSPLFQESNLAVTFVLKAKGSLEGLARAVSVEVRAADTDLPVFSPRSMDDVVLEGLGERRLAARLTASFAVIALALAVLGIYGVTSYGVRRRTRELGIRLALGAKRREILTLVVARGMKLSLMGIGAGLVSALAGTRYLKSLLFEVSPTDPLTLGAISLLLAGSALAACYIPARRAARLDPLTALRHE
jgi:putative ABC transport system permease protein